MNPALPNPMRVAGSGRVGDAVDSVGARARVRGAVMAALGGGALSDRAAAAGCETDDPRRAPTHRGLGTPSI